MTVKMISSLQLETEEFQKQDTDFDKIWVDG